VRICEDIEMKSEGRERKLWLTPLEIVQKPLRPQLGLNVPITPTQDVLPHVVDNNFI